MDCFANETNMFAYDNPEPIAPHMACEGELYQYMAGDIDCYRKKRVSICLVSFEIKKIYL